MNGQRKRWKVSEAEMKEYIIKVDVSKPDIMGGMPLMEPAKELIRCKDCIHYRYYGLTDDTVSKCTIGYCENPDKEWFCADGER